VGHEAWRPEARGERCRVRRTGGREYGHLRGVGLIEGRRLTRRKLGLALPGFGEFHLMIEAKDLAQLEAAFPQVAGRREPPKGFISG
jgi:hypothetical protein